MASQPRNRERATLAAEAYHWAITPYFFGRGLSSGALCLWRECACIACAACVR